MTAVLLVIHVLIAIALVAVILLQRSEGGALGIGSGPGGLMSARGAGNVLTRMTAILATAFFATSILLTVIQSAAGPETSIIEQIESRPAAPEEAPESEPEEPAVPAVPLSD